MTTADDGKRAQGPRVRQRLRSFAKRRRPPRPPKLSIDAWRHFLGVAVPYWQGSERKAAWGLLVLLMLLMVGDTYLAVLLNRVTGELTSALAAHESPRFWAAVKYCLILIALAVPTFALYYFMRDAFANRWRRWLTARYLDGYLADRRFYRLTQSYDIDNPDQRIAEDINTFTARSANLLLIFMGSGMQLVAFSAVLWSISKLLVAFLAVYALLGTYVALVIFGSPLIRLNFFQLRREADFRFGLIRLRENAESIAFYRGEQQERRQLDEQFNEVYANYEQLIRKQRSLNLFQRAFSQLTIVVPSIILAEQVLSGQLEVGVAVQAGGAFAAVLLAVSVIVERFEELSRFVAGIDRLHTLKRVLIDQKTADSRLGRESAGVRPGAPHKAGEGRRGWRSAADEAIAATTASASSEASPAANGVGQIQHVTGDRLEIEDMTLFTPQTHRLLVENLSLRVEDGEGLLISGPSGCGKSSLLRAIAGLWGDGSGTVTQPPVEKMFYLPQRPYMQIGTLREQLLYPDATLEVSDEQLEQALQDVQLPKLLESVGGFDAWDDWQKRLSLGEQQRVAFARVLLRKPEIVILDEGTSALDATNETRLYRKLRESGATIVSIAHRAAVLAFHDRVLQLDGEGGWRVVPAADFSFEDVADAALFSAAARAPVEGPPGAEAPPMAGSLPSPVAPLPPMPSA